MSLLTRRSFSAGLAALGACTTLRGPEEPPATGIAWPEGISWLTWEAARRRAVAEDRTTFLLAYANWCPTCQGVAPWFSEPDLVAASGKLLAVKQDVDEEPPWLEAYASAGGYVPRMLFIRPDGTLDTTITSARTDYPYFYDDLDVLVASMNKAAGA